MELFFNANIAIQINDCSWPQLRQKKFKKAPTLLIPPLPSH